jgi:superfamily II DNA or RNA helicase
MKMIKREPGIGYLDNWLWVPKTHTHETQIAATFSYVARNDKLIEAWRDEPHHFRLPRNYHLPATLPKLPYKIYDTRIKTFPRVQFHSKVVLDKYEPDKDYQRRGSAALLSAQDGLLCLRCGAGKTVVGLHTASLLGVPILIQVKDDSLAEQWLEEIEDFLGIHPKDVGRIGGGKFKWQYPICVANVQSLAARAADESLPDEMIRHFGCVMPDEAHMIGAPYFNLSVPPFHGRRWGLTATPERADGYDSLLKYTMGEVVYSYLTPDLIPDVVFRELPTTLDFEEKNDHGGTHDSSGKFHYGMTYGYLARSNKTLRNDRIVHDIQAALAMDRQVLVLTHTKEMTEILGRMIPGSGVVNSDVKGKERRRRIRECNPIIAVMTLGKEALNKPMLDTLFMVEPAPKPNVLQQIMGRILRKYFGKQKPMMIVFDEVHIREIRALGRKIRKQLNEWPAAKGGKIPHHTIRLARK